MGKPNRGPGTFAIAGGALVAAAIGAVVFFSPERQPSRSIRVVAVSPAGQRLAAGTAEGNIHIWDLQTSALSSRVVESAGRLNDLRFSPNSEHLAIANRNITVVSLASGVRRVVRADGANYGTVQFRSDGGSLLSVNGKGTVMTMEAETGAVQVIHCCTSIWGDVAYSADETRVIWAGHWPGVWDLRRGALAGRLTAAREVMTFGPIAMDTDGETIYLGSQDGRVYWWHLETQRLLGKSRALGGYVRTIGVLGESGWVAYAAEGGAVHLWHPARGESRVATEARTTSNLAFDESRNRTAFGTESGNVEFWDLPGGKLLSRLPIPREPR